MLTKRIDALTVGDKLKRKSNSEIYELKQIVNDDEDKELNYCFFGFCVKNKVMKKFFDSIGEEIFIYN